MKILILAHHAEGLYLPRRELMMQLKAAGHTVIASIPRGKCYEKVAAIVDEVIETPVQRRGMNPIKDLRLIFFYRRLLKQYKPDCILSFAIKPNLYGGMMGRWYHIPYLMNVTGLGTAFAKDNLLCKVATFLYKLVAGHEQTIFFQNEGNRLTLERHGVFWKNPVLIPGSGVNLNLHKFEEYPSDEDSIKFVFVSRILKEKGIYELAEAAREIRKEYQNVEFHVLGKCEDGYEKVVKKWHKEGIVIYHGHQNDVHEYLKKAHALIHPSYYPEGMSNVCLEASATGRPVITTCDIYGCKETIEDGVTGLGVKARNVQDLYSAIVKFINLPYEEKKKMGIAARKKMENEFDRRIVIRAYQREIQQIEGK
ncbi:galacturonosyltransferase [Selenomonas ruminantium]|uniref:Galacturonosyltransferase n=1 Tax=Selenomonas ruminantium TaxID=971 RepID=A0A1I3BY24_SELRU|nr:glycosyltransferase family 4 protein [Selenomonas ruminantium]SFH67080.1 galacturonosyltransferase [Selenomonas ruminantium]